MTASPAISIPSEARVVAWSLGVSLAFVLAAFGVAALA
jgi:hypothetical protein